MNLTELEKYLNLLAEKQPNDFAYDHSDIFGFIVYAKHPNSFRVCYFRTPESEKPSRELSIETMIEIARMVRKDDKDEGYLIWAVPSQNGCLWHGRLAKRMVLCAGSANTLAGAFQLALICAIKECWGEA